MGLFMVYGVTGVEEPVEDETGWVASVRGWVACSDWLAGLGDDFPLLAELAEEGQVYDEDESPATLGQLEGELARALAERPGDPTRDALDVGRQLLQALRRRPEGTAVVIITDGQGVDDDEEDQEGDDLEDGLGGAKSLSCGSRGPACSCSTCRREPGEHPCDAVGGPGPGHPDAAAE
jgi:hypothetical protein